MDFINNNAVEVHTMNGKFVGKWPSAALAIKELGLKSPGNVQGCLHGIRKSVQGYTFKFSPEKVAILNGEIWKPVVGFESLYAVSNKGRVASLQYHGKKTFSIMSQSNVKRYKTVKIRNSKIKFERSLKVHRLVAEAFIPNPENKPCIDHIDANPANNCVENLRWVTALENQRNPLTLSKIRNNIKKMNYAKIGPNKSAINRSIKVKHQSMIYNSVKEAGIATGHTISTILRWCRGHKHNWSIV